jgi:NAD(P)-dependent dehydrogenase (short-subunit alcohol dehydrogenase family)
MKIEQYFNENISRLDNKLVIITGSNSGIGYLTALMASKKGAKIVLACRSESKALVAIEAIKKEVPNAELEYTHYDQASFNSIDEFVEVVKTKYKDFYALFLNAGILKPEVEKFTEQGFPLTVGTNFYGLIYLLNKLYPFIKKTKKEKRIIFEGSLVGRYTKYNSTANALEETSSKTFKAYNLSKVGVHSVFYKYCSENTNKNLKFLLAEPGICKTEIIKNFPRWIKKPANIFMNTFMNHPEKGALPSLHLISENHINGDSLYPDGLLSIAGFPKNSAISNKDKKKFKQIYDDAKSIIDARI